MLLDVYIGNDTHQIEVTKEAVERGKELFEKMDRDMDVGWRMGPEFIENPGRLQRGQIVASKLLVAIETNNEMMTHALAAYICSRLPEVHAINIDLNGEPLNTDMVTTAGQSVS